MIRAAAKNHESVAVVVDPADYGLLVRELDEHAGATGLALRSRLAAKAFAHTARYDTMIASFLAAQHPVSGERFPATLPLVWEKVQDLRYGENPHQLAAFYRDPALRGASIASARALQGKELSFNNVADADTAIECVRQFEEPACVIVKHANPCGAALGSDPLAAYEAAYRTDPTSAFGGIIAFNRALDASAAEAILARQFAELIAAPEVSTDALRLLAGKPGIRVLALGDLQRHPTSDMEYRSVTGGLLAQTRDAGAATVEAMTVATRRAPTPEELGDLEFAWRVCKFVKSNAIVYARDGATIGIGAGQTSRVHSCRIAAMKALDESLETAGAVMASDAFIPFRDSIDVSADHGIRAVIQPGGSRR
ncbi:MAG TPA: bifunctional phosphoribosylaminoimidazolecarboxamide formyltransferase/IMP cyclohydrolase, partial [Caldimonas sp.]|nr:bifunctional phosphoribosylaminoimidazolecarboxamide formyltransferase/IMP cyclohydrolase [Caldimonas sp.]